MSLLFDQNLSRKLVARLAVEYPGSEQIVLAGLTGADDTEIWKYAISKGLAIVSKDEDFRQLAKRLGSPPKFIWLRVGNGPTSVVENLLRSRLVEVLAFLADPARSILELH